MTTTVLFKKQRVIFDDLMDSNYQSYLETDEWKEKVKESAIEHDWTCQLCFQDVRGRGGGTLHHISYDDLFEEQGKNEVYVCKECHIYR